MPSPSSAARSSRRPPSRYRNGDAISTPLTGPLAEAREAAARAAWARQGWRESSPGQWWTDAATQTVEASGGADQTFSTTAASRVAVLRSRMTQVRAVEMGLHMHNRNGKAFSHAGFWL